MPTAWAVRWGLGVALVGMAAALFMTGPTPDQLTAAQAGDGMPRIGAHAVGVGDGGPGLPLVGWSTTGGDLRIGHFVGLHAMQGLPLLAFALAGLAGRWPVLRAARTRARLVGAAGLAWGGLTVLLVWQALRGQPLLAPDTDSLAVLGVLVVGALAGALAVLRAGRREQAAVGSVEPAGITPKGVLR